MRSFRAPSVNHRWSSSSQSRPSLWGTALPAQIAKPNSPRKGSVTDLPVSDGLRGGRVPPNLLLGYPLTGLLFRTAFLFCLPLLGVSALFWCVLWAPLAGASQKGRRALSSACHCCGLSQTTLVFDPRETPCVKGDGNRGGKRAAGNEWDYRPPLTARPSHSAHRRRRFRSALTRLKG